VGAFAQPWITFGTRTQTFLLAAFKRMPVPDRTSAEAIDYYAVGTRILASEGTAWDGARLSVFALPPVAEAFTMPAVNEPFIAWITSGEAEAQERENDGPWITSRLKKGSLFLTAGGAPYDFRWRTITYEPFEVVLVLLSLTLFNEALEDVFGPDAPYARLGDLSGFEDSRLTSLYTNLIAEIAPESVNESFLKWLNTEVAIAPTTGN
jgi:AraC family transcriptional regulator